MKLPVEKLGTLLKTITGLKRPWGVAISHKGNIIVAEDSDHCVSVFSPEGKKIKSFGSLGSGPGHFNGPAGVAVDDEYNILVVDWGNNRIQLDGKFIRAVDKLVLKWPVGIAIHSHNRKVYVADCGNHHIQILNSDLTVSSSFGREGIGDGQFNQPYDVPDGIRNVYVANTNKSCIQVFRAEWRYLRKFGNMVVVVENSAGLAVSVLTVTM